MHKYRKALLKACEEVENEYASCIAISRAYPIPDKFALSNNPLVNKYCQFYFGEDYTVKWDFSSIWTEEGKSERVLALLFLLASLEE